jgi:hypothetical protein
MILRRIDAVLRSKALRVIFLVLWATYILLRLDRTWVWEECTIGSPSSGIPKECLYNFIDKRELASIIWLTMPIVAFVAYRFKRWSVGYYGLVEVIVGVAVGFFVLSKLAFESAQDWLALATATYVVVRGFENFHKGVAETAPVPVAQTQLAEPN